jgi:hypothetical protein
MAGFWMVAAAKAGFFCASKAEGFAVATMKLEG